MRATSLIATVIVLAMVVAGFGVAMTNVSAYASARDAAGYYYTDSKAPTPSVALSWIEIRNTGTYTGASGDDDTSYVLPIGFDFEFYDRRYSALNVSTNALVMFGTSSTVYSNGMIPSTSSVNGFVAAYWDDLYAGYGEVVYQTVGAAPYRQFVVEWYNVTRLSGSNLMTFEVVLNETSNDIWCQYLTLNGETGTGATEGIENQYGTVGLQYGYNSAVLTDSLAIRYSPGIVTIGPSDTKSGRFSDTLTYNLIVFNRQSFTDSFAITYTSVLGWTVTVYDALMNPLSDTDGDAIPDTGSVPSNSFALIIAEVRIPGSPGSSTETTTFNASSRADPLVFDTCVLTSMVAPAWLSPPHSDFGYDTDMNGDYNYLVVNVSVHVFTSGWYYIEGNLHTSSEWPISWDGGWVYYTPGDQTYQLMYYGWLINEMGVDGPYHVHITLEDDWGNPLGAEVYDTAAYVYTDFMEVPASFAPPFSDNGVDADSDGLYDYLAINVVLDVNYDGRFVVEGYLYDSSWNYMGYDDMDTDLVAGARTVTLLYDAWDLTTQGVNGQFYVDLRLEAEVDGVLLYLDSYGYYTLDYDLADFERPNAIFQPPHSEHTVDIDSDGLYDYLVIDVEVNVTVEGDYSVRGMMEDSWGDVCGVVTNSTHLTVGVHTVELAFLGWPMYYYGVDGPYDVYLSIYGQDGLLDEDYYETFGYDSWSFEDVLGWFEPPYSEMAIDNDGDALFDYLMIEVTVNVTVAGTYVVEAYLVDMWGGQIEFMSNTTYFVVGNNTVEIWFTGWMINNSYDDGPYDIELYLYDSSDRNMDYDWFSTGSYLYTDFEGVPAYLGYPHSSWAVDDDADPYFDKLVINVTVEVNYAGNFLVVCDMYDSDGYWVGVMGVWATLDVGTQVVPVEFPAWLIYAHGWVGTYYSYIYLYDPNLYELDSSSHTTELYDYSDFDPEKARINSPLTDSPPTVDGVMGATEWAAAVAIDLSAAYPLNMIAGTMYVMNDNDNLYIGLDAYGDTTEDLYDHSSIAFDTGNDGVATDGGEDEFVLSTELWNQQLHYEYSEASMDWLVHCSPFDHDGLLGAFGFGQSTDHLTGHRVYEYAIPLSLLEASAGDVIGFALDSRDYDGIYDYSTDLSSAWPMYYSWDSELADYGEIALSEYIPPAPPSTSATVSGTAGTNGWYVSSVTVTLTATGGTGGIDYTEYRLDGGSWTTYSTAIPIAGDGTHSLEFRSVDNTAMVETTKTLTVKIDKVLPVTAAAVSGAYVWLNCTDATSGVGSILYRIDGGSWLTSSGMITVAGVGTHTLEFYATDVAGNTEAAQSVTVVVEETSDDDGGVLGSGAIVWIVLVLLAVVAAIVIVLLLMKRRKGQQPADMGPAASAPMEPPPPQA